MNIFDKDIKYITPQEVKDSTLKADLRLLSDDEVKLLISKAEDIINNYIWYTLDYENANDSTKYDFKVSTFYCVEQIYESWDLINPASSTSTWSWAISSEKVWDRQISYDVWTTTSTTDNLFKYLWIPEQAKTILDKYRNIFFKMVI